MSLRRLFRTVLGQHWVLIALVVLSGCRTQSQRADATDGLAGILALGMDGVPGDDPVRTLDYLGRLTFDLTLPDSSIAYYNYPCASCGSERTARLMIVPEKQAHTVDWERALTKRDKGYVVALVRNVSEYRIPDFDMEPGGVMYQWVGEVAHDVRRAAFLQVSENGGVTFWGVRQTVSFCKEPRRKRPAAKLKAHDASCPTYTGVGLLPGGSPQRVTVPAQTWISCAGGCCQPADQSVAELNGDPPPDIKS